MRSRHSVSLATAVALVLVFGMGPGGPNDEVWTPAIWGARNCYVTNVSGSNIEAEVQLLDDEGRVRPESGHTLVIPPAATAQVRVKALREERPTVCRVVVQRADWVRVSLCREFFLVEEDELQTLCLPGQ
jgi:hypothetical protein